MSRPWSKALRLRLERNSVHAELSRAWPRAAVLAQASHSIATDPKRSQTSNDAAATDPLVQAIANVLAELDQASPVRGARLHVDLADSLVHLDVAEGEFAGVGDRELQAIAAACTAEILGDTANDQDLRWQLQSDDRHLLICAVSRHWTTLLSETAARLGLQLASVQPHFCLQWNLHSRVLQPGGAVFAVTSNDDAVIAYVTEGVISAISSGAWDDEGDASATHLARVDRLLSGLGLDRGAPVGSLDMRVDRLLSCMGLDHTQPAAFVLVGADVSARALSTRWTVLPRDEALA